MASKNYEVIAARMIRDPEASRPLRLFFYSRNKKGKTRLCLSAQKGLLIDPESGSDPYLKWAQRTGSKIWPVSKWEDVEEVYGFLRTGKHDFDWVSLDGMTRIHRMALNWVRNQEEQTNLDRKPGQIDKRDYGRAGTMIEQLTLNLSALPIGVIYTAQERMIQSETGDEDDDSVDASTSYVADLPKGARAAVNSIVDVIGRLYTVPATVKVRGTEEERDIIQRRLWLEPHVSYDTGYRSEYTLPRYLKNPTVPALVRLIKEGPKT